MDINNIEHINHIRDTIENELGDYYSGVFHKIFDFLIKKGFNNKKSNIIEIKNVTIHLEYRFIEDGELFPNGPIGFSHTYPPNSDYTFIFSEWASIMDGTYKLYNFSSSKPELIVDDDTRVNILILNGGGYSAREPFNDFKTSILQKFIPHISEDCIIIIENDHNGIKHAKKLLIDHGYKNIENIYYYETT